MREVPTSVPSALGAGDDVQVVKASIHQVLTYSRDREMGGPDLVVSEKENKNKSTPILNTHASWHELTTS